MIEEGEYRNRGDDFYKMLLQGSLGLEDIKNMGITINTDRLLHIALGYFPEIARLI